MKIPAIEELKKYNNWVAYSASKLPVSPRGRPASSTDVATWGTLEEAKFIRKVQQLKGVGFVFSPADPFVGIDLDNSIDPVTDKLYPWAQEIVERIDSYTELSPSKTGVHIWVKSPLPRNGATRLEDNFKVEVYKQGRYFTVTGLHLSGTPKEIIERDITEWFNEVFTRPETESSKPERTFDLSAVGWDSPEVESWLGEALTYIDSEDYHQWTEVGMAIKTELGDRGFTFWDTWSSAGSKYGGTHATEAKWKTFSHAGAFNIATVVWKAEKNGFKVPRGGPKIHPAMDGDWDKWLTLQQDGVEDPDGMGHGLELIIHDAVDLYQDRTPFEPDLISPGVLGTGDMMLLFGPPKSMKSMVIMDMFRNFALGRAWCGLTPAKPLTTMYAQFEVKGDKMRERLQLTPMSDEDLEAMRGKFMITDRFTPVLNADFVFQFAEAVLEKFRGGLDILILDPLANIYTGDSENDNAQMAKFIRQLKVLRNAIDPKVAIVLVHHSSKMSREDRHQDPFNSGRGASSLRGSYDAGMYLDRMSEESTNVKLWTELRNGPRNPPFELAFNNGRFTPADDLEQVDMDLGHLGEVDAERIAYERLLKSEAIEGRYYTSATFAEVFEGGDIGSAATIRRHLSRLATRGALAWFTSVGDEWLPEAHHRSQGYLCCRGMVLAYSGRIYEVIPQRIKDPASGVIRDTTSWPS
jgi:hypothetical protein